MAGYDETGSQQEAWWRVFLCNCHNCSFDRDLPGLHDEVIILFYPYHLTVSKETGLASHVWELEKIIRDQMSSSSPLCFVNIGVHVREILS